MELVDKVGDWLVRFEGVEDRRWITSKNRQAIKAAPPLDVRERSG